MTTSNEHNTAHAVPAVIECPISIGGSGSELASVTPDGDATIHWTAVEQAAKEGNHFLSAMAKLMIAARDVGRAPAPAVPQDMRLVPVWLLERVERSLGAFTSDEGWAQTDMDTMDSVSAMLAATPASAPAQGEPFGHFRVEPFGWTDCAKDDEGAIALYERPQEVGLTDEALDNLIEDLSEWSRHVVEDTAHQTLEAHVREVLAKNPIIAALRAKGGKHV